MLNTINADTVNNVISSLASAIASLKTEMANIDEKYKKLLEEAKTSLAEALAETENQYHYWLVVRGDLPAPEKKTRRRSKKTETPAETPVVESAAVEPVVTDIMEPETFETEAAPEEEEKIVDTLFDENNTVEDEEEPAIEESSTVEDDMPEDWGEEASTPTVESDSMEWPEETEVAEEKAEEKEEVTVDAVDDNNWPEFPEEWK
mgnify:CR=1 FL=1